VSGSYQQTLIEARRRAVLDILAEAPDFEEGETLIALVLQSDKHSGSMAAADLAWLESAGLVTRASTGGLIRARLTPLGVDVAAGLARVPGVGRKL
jgi:hypothetical protein